MNYLSTPRVIPLPRESEVGDLDAHIARLDADLSRDASCYVFRTTPELFDSASEPSAEKERAGVLKRSGAKPVLILSYRSSSQSYQLKRLVPEGACDILENDAISQLRQKDLERVILDAGDKCLIKESASYHYVTPSLNHASTFLRLGDAISSVDALNTLGFWLLQLMAGAEGILLDSWSIASLALRPLQILGKNHSDVFFDCLPGHPEQDKQGCRQVLEQLMSRVHSPQNVLFLISVASSGRCIADIRELMGPEASLLRPVAIYKFASSPVDLEALCRLESEIVNFPASNCALW